MCERISTFVETDSRVIITMGDITADASGISTVEPGGILGNSDDKATSPKNKITATVLGSKDPREIMAYGPMGIHWMD